MPFATVKSDPWKKGKPIRRRNRRGLWTAEQWKKLVAAAKDDLIWWTARKPHEYPISPSCYELILQFNRAEG